MSYLTLDLTLPARGAGDEAPIGPLQFQSFADGSWSAEDITGYSFVLVIDASEAPASSASNVCSIAGEIVSAEDGTYQFVPDADLIAAPALSVPYWYAIKATPPDGRERTIAKGRLPIISDLTP